MRPIVGKQRVEVADNEVRKLRHYPLLMRETERCRGQRRPRAALSRFRHMRSIRGVRLEPVHDQTGDSDFALEVREVPDSGQDNILYMAP